MKHLPLLALLCTSVAAQTAVAHVNDPVSPGAAQDARLSLDEAIRIVNLQLPISQLSAAERAQITGAGTPTVIEIDAKVTPKILLQQNTTPLDGQAAHIEVEIHGANGVPVLDASGRDHGLYLRTNHAHVEHLAIRFGKIGILADTSKHLHPGHMAMLHELELRGQTVAGLRLQASGDKANTPVMVRHALITAMPTGVVLDDRSSGGGAIMAVLEHVDFEGVDLGMDVYLASSGSTTMCRTWGGSMRNSGMLLRERRAPGSDQRAMLMLVGGDFETTGDMVDVESNALIESALHFHHSIFKPAKGKRAFNIWPQTGRIDFHGSENVVYGDIDLLAGQLNRRIWAWNNVFRDGTWSITNEGARPNMRWNKFENYTLRATAANRTRVEMTTSEFYDSTLDGQSRTAGIILSNCLLRRTTTTGTVTNQSPAPSPWFGHASASTQHPKLGGTIDLTLDLPPGIVGAWHFGDADKQLSLTEEPFRFYANRNVLVALPVPFILHTTIRLTIPNDPALAGVELYALPMTAPYLGQTHVPAVSLPAGVFITPTN